MAPRRDSEILYCDRVPRNRCGDKPGMFPKVKRQTNKPRRRVHVQGDRGQIVQSEGYTMSNWSGCGYYNT